METLAKIFLCLDVVMMTYALHKLYHSMFGVIYFSIGAYIKELFITVIGAIILVAAPGAALGILERENGQLKLGSGQFLYFAAFFVIAIFISSQFNKPKKE